MIYLILFWVIIGFLSLTVLSFLFGAVVYTSTNSTSYMECVGFTAIALICITISIVLLVFAGRYLIDFLKWLYFMYEQSLK